MSTKNRILLALVTLPIWFIPLLAVVVGMGLGKFLEITIENVMELLETLGIFGKGI